MSNSSFIVVLITSGSYEEAEKISTSLVEKKLAACCNIIKGVTSIYEWEGKLEKSEECLIIAKTDKALFAKVKDDVLLNHSYDMPEIISLPITDGLEGYLNWVGDKIKE